jgi:hypothetical protein
MDTRAHLTIALLFPPHVRLLCGLDERLPHEEREQAIRRAEALARRVCPELFRQDPFNP